VQEGMFFRLWSHLVMIKNFRVNTLKGQKRILKRTKITNAPNL